MRSVILGKKRMSQKEYEDTVRYYIFHLLVYPFIVVISIFFVSGVIESFVDFNFGVGKTIFASIGGIEYFVWYFRRELNKKK